ncbi:DEAD/DEAH box helicase [Lentisphaerota bacterium WC36G]|nr:DEAD/DEAH box helicase [Lentisphaerae bacterium WC36]
MTIKNNEIELNDEQTKALNYLRSTNDNIFITGNAGTGKSTLLNAFLDSTPKKIAKLAFTGLAADNIDGVTIDSFFAIPYNCMNEELIINIDEASMKIKLEVHAILIDEISLVNCFHFQMIDKSLRKYLDSTKPFGGMQMIVVGDFCQLTLEATKNFIERKILKEHGGVYAFNSTAWQKANFQNISLETIHRQEDSELKHILNILRDNVNKLTYKDLALLNSNVREFAFDPTAICLCSSNKNVSAINNTYNKIFQNDTASKSYTATSKNYKGKKPNDRVLTFWENQRIMLNKNLYIDGELKFVNGCLGRVLYIFKDEIVVQFDNVSKVTIIHRDKWENTQLLLQDGHLMKTITGTFTQFPLKTAYAITIHKAQGQTLKRVHIINDEFFAPYQFYTALSRVRSLEDVSFQFPVTREQLQTSLEVIKFYNNLQTIDLQNLDISTLTPIKPVKLGYNPFLDEPKEPEPKKVIHDPLFDELEDVSFDNMFNISFN